MESRVACGCFGRKRSLVVIRKNTILLSEKRHEFLYPLAVSDAFFWMCDQWTRHERVHMRCRIKNQAFTNQYPPSRGATHRVWTHRAPPHVCRIFVCLFRFRFRSRCHHVHHALLRWFHKNPLGIRYDGQHRSWRWSQQRFGGRNSGRHHRRRSWWSGYYHSGYKLQ